MKGLGTTDSPHHSFPNLSPSHLLSNFNMYVLHSLYFYIVIQLHQPFIPFLPLHSLYSCSCSLSNLSLVSSLYCSCIQVCMMSICIYIPKCNLVSLYNASSLSKNKKNCWCSDIENKSKGTFSFLPNFYI